MLGILLADAVQFAEALGHIERGIAAGRDTHLFLMDDAVTLAHDPMLAFFIDAGLEAALCATDAAQFCVAPTPSGPRFGSQYDHAQMLKGASEFVALTGGVATAQRLTAGTREAAIVLHSAPDARRAYQGLRAAVGYLSSGIQVSIFGSPQLFDAHAPAHVARTVATLRGLGHPIAAPDHAHFPPGAARIIW